MADSEFWRKLANKFRKLAEGAELHIAWSYSLKTKRSYFAFAYDHANDDVAADFEVLAILGGREIEPTGKNPRDSWLHAVRINSRSTRVNRVNRFDPETGREGPFNTGWVEDICKRSAIHCTRLQAQSLRTESVVTATALPAVTTTMENTDPIAKERAQLLLDYKNEGRRAGIKVTDLMIAKAASTSWNDRTQVTWWKRNDPRSTSAADAAIRRVLRDKPHLKPL